MFFNCSGNVVNKRRNQEVQISHLMKRLIYCSQPPDSRVPSSCLNTLYFNFYPQKMTICVTIASVEHGGWIRKIKQVGKKFKFVLTCLLIVFLLAPRGFSPNTPVSFSSSALSKFQFNLKRTNTSVPRS